MSVSTRILLVLATLCITLHGARGTFAADTQPAAPRIAKLKYMQLDMDRRRVVLAAQVCRRQGPLEFVLCREDTKEHESILSTRATASDLHAALLALNLTAGKPAEWVGTDDQARFLPPRGAEIRIMICWRDEAGEAQTAPAERWLRSTDKNVGGSPNKWVFVGSELFADGGYWADLDGGIISVANFGSAVIDVPFESSNVDSCLSFEARTGAIPPIGTPVQVVFAPAGGAENAIHARATLEISPVGELKLEGQRVAFDKLQQWARRYIARHEKGRVVLRAWARTMVWDVERVRNELRAGGVREFDRQIVEPDAPLLPRTAEQAQASLLRWQERLAQQQGGVRSPYEEMQRVLLRVQRESRVLDGRKALLKDYAARLRSLLESSKTRSTSKSGGESE